MSDEPITEAQIEDAFEKASQEEEEFTLLQFDELARIAAVWLNPHGVFTPDGRQIGSTCGCEDYPCCGH